MCGISGFNWPDEKLVQFMNRANKNRGPDDEGVFIDSHVSLGHVRLSIIDLSINGHQPMPNMDETKWIVYNGEIYNFHEIKKDLENIGYRFNSLTDTEIVIKAYEAYGLNCLHLFNGMWAFCIYDSLKQQLILCRDRFGIKPLYYYSDDQRFIFSSMISGIMCHSIRPTPNNKAIMQFLAFNLEDHGKDTFFNNIKRIEPGHCLIYDMLNRSHKIEKWYTLEEKLSVDEKDLREAFIGSIRLRTLSDVPLGACLSGGVDSSAIVCTLKKILNHSFPTFSYIAPGERFNEKKYMDEISQVAQTKPYFTKIDIENLLSDLEDFVVALEEPVLDLSVYAQYRLMKLANQQGIKVLLDGQGGDELFAGYTYFFSYLFVDLFQKGQWQKLVKEAHQFIKKTTSFFPVLMFGFLMLPDNQKSKVWRTMLNNWINHDFLNLHCGNLYDPRWEKMNVVDALRLTLFVTSIPHLLRWEDKTSMRWGIETRIPFLDVNLVELAHSLPSETKIHNGESKIIYKRSIKNLLPQMIMQRNDKVGFQTPIDAFFRHPKLAQYCKNIFFSNRFKNRPYWNWQRVQKMFGAHIENKGNYGKEIWKLLSLEIWIRIFFESG